MLEKIRGEGGRESLWYYASKRKKKINILIVLRKSLRRREEPCPRLRVSCKIKA